MKNHYVILFLLVSAFSSHAQPTSRIFVNYGLNSHILIGKALDGAGGQDGKGGNIAGLRYFRNISRTLALETGLEYSHYKFSITPAPQSGTERPGRKETMEIISVPVYANFTFAKYMFINGGLIADLQVNKKKTDTVDRQSGLGVGIGFGGKYDLKNLTFSVNPYLQQHTIIPFESVRNHERLLEAGIRFGVGYNF